MVCVEETLVIWLLTFMCLTSNFLAGQDCDVDLVSSISSRKEGKFYSPGWNHTNNFSVWNQRYPNGKRCVYKFVGQHNEKVKIAFEVFDVQGMKPECRYDYVDIYIELSSASDNLLDASVLGRFCGDSLEEIPKLLISTHNVIIIVFFSDENKNDIGFEGSYEFIDASIYNAGALASPNSCSYSINSRELKRGFVVSPTYPGIYPDNMACTYEFSGLPGERIKLTFIDFSIFHGGDYCPFDYALIKDGRDGYSEDIGTFCGKYTNVTLFSTREFLKIEFVTRNGRVSFDKDSLDNSADYKFDRKGFNISFEFSDRFVHLDLRNSPDATHIVGTECDVKIESRGGSNGTFKSPGYPSDFARYATCRYFLDGEMNIDRLEKVEVNFRDFLITGDINDNCTQGYLGVNRQGHREGRRIDERFCGELWPPKLISNDPRMILTFETRGATRARFVASYRFLADYGISGRQIDEGRCGFLFESKTGRRGTFNTPRHPTNYQANMECTYVFRPSSKNERLLISFEIFSLNPASENDTMCTKTDYLEVNKLNPGTEGGRYITVAKYCGTVFPAPIISNEEVQLKFKSFKNSSHLGFKAIYEFLAKSQLHTHCGKRIHSDGSGGIIKSPNFPLKYKSYTFCEWRIQASKRENKILVQFDSFKLEGKMMSLAAPGTGCKNSVLRIINGESIKELCGTRSDANLDDDIDLSTGDFIVIRFLTSSRSLGANGFRISWTEIHEGGQCYGFKCKTSGYCISSDLKCNNLPNCGPKDNSDESCPAKAEVQVLHIAIGTSISVFFCVVLLICGVYHRKKFRTRDRHGVAHDHVEVRYVAATSGSNTTDRLLTLEKTPDQTQTDQTDRQMNTQNNQNDHNDQSKQNHNSTPQDNNKQPRPVSAPKIQKVSIV